MSLWVKCACVPVCVPGSGGTAVLTASLGTYKPCGRICLRCRLKAFSNPPPLQGWGGGRARKLKNPIQLPPSNQPSARHRGTAGASATVSWPCLAPGGSKAKEEGSCLAFPGGKAKNPVPSRPPFHNCYRKSNKIGQPRLLGPGNQSLQVAPAEDSHSPFQGPDPHTRARKKCLAATTAVCIDWNKRGLRDPDLPMLHRASAAQGARQTLKIPVLCSQGLQSLRPSRSHFGEVLGHWYGEGEYLLAPASSIHQVPSSEGISQDIWCGSPAAGGAVLLETDGQV